MKKEIRGKKAARYAERQGIFIDVDEDFLLGAEGRRLGRRATEEDLDILFTERLGRVYDATDLLPGGEGFDLLVGVYGDRWVYVALEGNDPAREERAVLRMYRQLLKERNPSCGGDLLDLAARYAVHSYGNRRFFVPPDGRMSLSGAMCGACREELRSSSPRLHRECAGRLRKILGNVTWGT